MLMYVFKNIYYFSPIYKHKLELDNWELSFSYIQMKCIFKFMYNQTIKIEILKKIGKPYVQIKCIYKKFSMFKEKKYTFI